MADLSAPASEAFEILRSFDYEVFLYDENSNRTDDPALARRMFAAPDNLMVTLADKGDDSGVTLSFGASTDANSILGLRDKLDTSATKFNLLFNFRQHGKEINPKDFSTAVAEAIQKDISMNLTEGMYGTSRSSYLTLESPQGGRGARLIVKHSAKIDETKMGARGRSIDRVFVENAVGERFLFPTQNLAPARAMTQHVNHGGTFADVVGAQIQRMATDYANLATCSSYVQQNGAMMAEGAGEVREACRCRMREMRKVFERLSRPAGYTTESTSITERASTLNEGEGTEVLSPDRLNEMRAVLAVEGREIDDMVVETALKAMNTVLEFTSEFQPNPELAAELQDLSTKVDKGTIPALVLAANIARTTGNLTRVADQVLKAVRQTHRIPSLHNRLKATLDKIETMKNTAPVDEAREAPKATISVLGRPVHADAWEAFKANPGSLELSRAPKGKGGVGFTDKTAELLFKLGEVVPVCRDDTMMNLLSFVADRMGEERDPAKVKVMRAIAGKAIRLAGLSLSEGISERNPAIREFAEWMRSLTTEAAVTAEAQDEDAVEADEALDDDDAVTECEKVDEELELSREDVLLPRADQGENLARDVTKPEVEDPADGSAKEPDAGYLSRLRQLSGLRHTGLN